MPKKKTIEFSKDQKVALKKLLKWYAQGCPYQYITLGGYAGTGKTTLVAAFRKILHDKLPDIHVSMCSYTGRAVQVLKDKLLETKTLYKGDITSTIHGLIYDPVENARGEIIGWDRRDFINTNLIIIDEASMVNKDIWLDLKSYNIPIIAVGDHGQLPPIHGKFNLMQDPHIKLEEIHRQVRDNPIIKISQHARKKGKVEPMEYGENVIKYSTSDMDTHLVTNDLLENYSSDTLILCGYNSTRNKINQFIRNNLGYELPIPQKGDRVICLRNNQKKEIYNGMLGTVLSIQEHDEDWYMAEIDMDNTELMYKGLIYAPQFGSPEPVNFTKDRLLAKKGDLFDFGYALTVHKAQGSQAKRVVLFEERFKQMDDEMWRRWLYTGITRAEEELYLIGE